MGGTDDVFAPGHIGGLTQVIPPDLVDAVLEETGARERRLRKLPSRVGVYFVLALGLFEYLGTGLVWDKLAAGLAARVPQPSEKALRDLRRRVGVAPLKRLFDVLAGPLAQPSTPGVRYRRWRTVAFDGCGSLSVPDHERNRSWLGRTERRYGPTGHPRLMLMTLCETGTRGLIAAVFGPASKGETDYAHDLTGHLTPDMLVLADRAFDSNELLVDIAAQGTQFLIRATSTRRPPVLALLPDGSYLTRIGGLPLRVIEAEIHSRTADGGDFGGTYRLLTTLNDHRTDPADHLVRLYHERWEIEITYLALRHTLLKGPSFPFEGPGGPQPGDVGTAHPLPGPALGHGDRGGDNARLRSRPSRLHRRSGSRPRHGGQPGRNDRDLRAEQPLRPGGTHRRTRSARAAPRAPDATVRPHRQVRNLPLQHLEPRRPSTRQHTDHRHRDHRAPTSPAQHAGPEPGPLRPLGPGLPALGRELQPGHAHPGHRTASRAPHLGAPLSSLTAQLCYWARNDRLIRTAPSTYKITLPDALTPPTGP